MNQISQQIINQSKGLGLSMILTKGIQRTSGFSKKQITSSREVEHDLTPEDCLHQCRFTVINQDKEYFLGIQLIHKIIWILEAWHNQQRLGYSFLGRCATISYHRNRMAMFTPLKQLVMVSYG